MIRINTYVRTLVVVLCVALVLSHTQLIPGISLLAGFCSVAAVLGCLLFWLAVFEKNTSISFFCCLSHACDWPGYPQNSNFESTAGLGRQNKIITCYQK